MTGERLQKVLARTGNYGSRREIERQISAGLILVNGKPAQLGDRVTPHDVIQIKGQQVKAAPRAEDPCRVLAYNKPEGEICSRADPKGRPTIFERLPPLRHGRWVAVGRLDINTSGLILLTTDGELAHRLMHPSFNMEREYAVRVHGPVTADILARLQRGVRLEDGEARFESVREAGGSGTNRWYHVVLMEGRQREVRRLWESQGVEVSRLIRTRFGPIMLPQGLRRGRCRELSDADLQVLRSRVYP
jgi:23S rRNA pseudouridine2605 synthase